MRLRYYFMISVIISILSMMISSLCIAQGDTANHEMVQTARWGDLRFGMFIRFDSLPAIVSSRGDQVSSQVDNNPDEDRNKFLTQFNPKLFSADEWVGTARKAGMQFIILSVRNRDGFCLFDSPNTDYDIAATSFKRDILKEVAEACRKRGMRFGWNYSLPDRNQSEVADDGGDQSDRLAGDDAERIYNEVDELLTKYGPVDVMLFGGNENNDWMNAQRGRLYDHVKSVSPDTIIHVPPDNRGEDQFDHRGDAVKYSDFAIYNNSIPQMRDIRGKWLTLITMNDWQTRSPAGLHQALPIDLIHGLITAVSRGGKYVLDVTAVGDGGMPTPAVDELKRVGEWLKINGDSVYKSKPSPFHYLRWGRATMDGKIPSRLYFYIFDWPTHDGMLRLPGLMSRVEKAWFLKRGPRAQLRTLADRGGVMVRVGRKPIDSLCTVLVVDVTGAPDIVDLPVFPQAHTGLVILEAGDAYLRGSAIRFGEGAGRNDLLITNGPEGRARWEFEIRKGGTFQLQINYASSEDTDNSEFIMKFYKGDDDTVIATKTITVTATEGDGFVKKDAGTVDLTEPGRYVLDFLPKDVGLDFMMRLRWIRLEPIS